MSFHHLTVSFNAGELSPLLDSRVDIEKYKTGCQRLENFLILPYGGVLRRPGTEFLGTTKFANKAARMISFNFSTTTNFVLEFGNEYIRFWSNGIQVQKSSAAAWVTATPYVAGNYVTESSIIYFCLVPHTSGTFATDLAAGKWVAQSILEVPTTYQEAELRDIHYCQIRDLMYLAHPNHHPAKLTRLSDDNWTWALISWIFPPTREENVGPITIAPSATTGNITLTASAALFVEEHVGSWWYLAQSDTGSFQEATLAAADQTTGAIGMLGSWELTTYGSWQGTLHLERQFTGETTWETIRTYNNSVVGERNVVTTGTESVSCLLRFFWDGVGVAGTNGLARIERGDTRIYGTFQITGFTSPTVVSATVYFPFINTSASSKWAAGAFTNTSGFPRTVALHESRLCFAGTRRDPLMVHGSFIDDFENFRQGSQADRAFSFTIAANESNPIQWMVSQQGKLLLGTSGEEWLLGPTDDTEALSPVNVNATRQSSYGSSAIQAKLVNEVIMFVQRQGRKVRELTFAFEKDAWVSPDLTILANQISALPIPPVPGSVRGLVEVAFQQQPDAIFWAATADGALAGMTYERDQNVVGWHRHSTDGVFESVAAIYGGTDADEVWFSVKRTVNSQAVRYIERMRPDHRESWESEDKATWWYLDSAKRSVFGSDTSVITGLSHLEGKTVGVFADGAVQPPKVVSGGQITLSTPAKNVLVGLPFFSTVKPMKLDAPMQDGTAQSRKSRIHRAVLNIHRSLGVQFSNDDVTWHDVPVRQHGDVMDESPKIVTGRVLFSTGAGYSDHGCEISLRQDKPMPLCILSVVAILDFYGE